MARHRSAARKALPGVTPKENKPEEIAPWEGPSIEWTGKGTTLCFEGYSGRLFYSCREEVERAIGNLNEAYEITGSACLNDLYRYLGIAETYFGEQHGWERGLHGSSPIDIRTVETKAENGERMLILEILTMPMDAWMEWTDD